MPRIKLKKRRRKVSNSHQRSLMTLVGVLLFLIPLSNTQGAGGLMRTIFTKAPSAKNALRINSLAASSSESIISPTFSSAALKLRTQTSNDSLTSVMTATSAISTTPSRSSSSSSTSSTSSTSSSLSLSTDLQAYRAEHKATKSVTKSNFFANTFTDYMGKLDLNTWSNPSARSRSGGRNSSNGKTGTNGANGTNYRENWGTLSDLFKAFSESTKEFARKSLAWWRNERNLKKVKTAVGEFIVNLGDTFVKGEILIKGTRQLASFLKNTPSGRALRQFGRRLRDSMADTASESMKEVGPDNIISLLADFVKTPVDDNQHLFEKSGTRSFSHNVLEDENAQRYSELWVFRRMSIDQLCNQDSSFLSSNPKLALVQLLKKTFLKEIFKTVSHHITQNIIGRVGSMLRELRFDDADEMEPVGALFVSWDFTRYLFAQSFDKFTLRITHKLKRLQTNGRLIVNKNEAQHDATPRHLSVKPPEPPTKPQRRNAMIRKLSFTSSKSSKIPPPPLTKPGTESASQPMKTKLSLLTVEPDKVHPGNTAKATNKTSHSSSILQTDSKSSIAAENNEKSNGKSPEKKSKNEWSLNKTMINMLMFSAAGAAGTGYYMPVLPVDKEKPPETLPKPSKPEIHNKPSKSKQSSDHHTSVQDTSPPESAIFKLLEAQWDNFTQIKNMEAKVVLSEAEVKKEVDDLEPTNKEIRGIIKDPPIWLDFKHEKVRNAWAALRSRLDHLSDDMLDNDVEPTDIDPDFDYF